MVYAYTMKNSGKGINPGPYGCDVKIAKPSGGGRVGPGTIKPMNVHPSHKSGK